MHVQCISPRWPVLVCALVATWQVCVCAHGSRVSHGRRERSCGQAPDENSHISVKLEHPDSAFKGIPLRCRLLVRNNSPQLLHVSLASFAPKAHSEEEASIKAGAVRTRTIGPGVVEQFSAVVVYDSISEQSTPIKTPYIARLLVADVDQSERTLKAARHFSLELTSTCRLSDPTAEEVRDYGRSLRTRLHAPKAKDCSEALHEIRLLSASQFGWLLKELITEQENELAAAEALPLVQTGDRDQVGFLCGIVTGEVKAPKRNRVEVAKTCGYCKDERVLKTMISTHTCPK